LSSRRHQEINNNIDVDQIEYQGLYIRNSHAIQVTQTEVQGLLLVQAALQAAIEAAIVVFGRSGSSEVKQLQKIAQSLDVTQVQKQTVKIVDSGEVTVLQTEIQVDAVVQAAINLLANLLVKFGA
jgi:gamma-glutamylcysteine synthetase